MNPEQQADNAEATRHDELKELAHGLMMRGVPPNMAERTVSLIYRMGYNDALCAERAVRMRFEESCNDAA